MKTIKVLISILLLSATCFAYADALPVDIYQLTIDQINHIYEQDGLHSHEQFNRLEIVKSNTSLIELLKVIIGGDEKVLKNIKAYYHPVGFIKVVLYKGKRGEQLRLHFWGKGAAKAIHQDFDNGWEPRHNHRWNFSSKVVAGGLNIHEFTDATNQQRYSSYAEANAARLQFAHAEAYGVYEVVQIPTRTPEVDYQVVKTGKYAIVGEQVNKYVNRGESYYIDHFVPHQVKADPETSTLLLMDPASKSVASDIFPAPDDAFFEEVDLDDLSGDELRHHCRDFLEVLESIGN